MLSIIKGHISLTAQERALLQCIIASWKLFIFPPGIIIDKQRGIILYFFLSIVVSMVTIILLAYALSLVLFWCVNVLYLCCVCVDNNLCIAIYFCVHVRVS